MSEPGEITRLLQEADEGNRAAENQLFAMVEKDLRAIAKKRKQAGPAALDMSTTILVNDAFLQLVGQDVTTWAPGDRRKFFGYVSRKMHDMLIQASRREGAAKRGGDRQRVPIDDDQPQGIVNNPTGDAAALLDLQGALDKFQQFAEEDALLFRLRFFLGCTFEEMAEIGSVSVSDSRLAWQRARSWLQRELKDYHHDA